jgi:hypothetical protein
MSIGVLQMLAEQRRRGNGTSTGARFRRDKQAHRAGRLHTGKPGDDIQIGLTKYHVAPDGSFRRQT